MVPRELIGRAKKWSSFQGCLAACLISLAVASPVWVTGAAPGSITPARTGAPRIGLALGGGARGLAHIGVLKVLQEAGVRIDCITGISMGSLIGGLYATGYSPDSLAHIARTHQWRALLADHVARRMLSIRERDERDRYWLTLPIRNGRPRLPQGFLEGQHILALLTRLTVPVHGVPDFHALPIPFRCLATDLETGELVVLDHGFLPQALRASIALPSIFTPEDIDGRLLVDGGLIRYLPASDTRAMGADIVIGVDIRPPLYAREGLDSFVKVLVQSVKFRGAATIEEERRLCDMLIEPDLREFGAADFDDADALMARGEAAARAVWPQLVTLADSVRRLRGVEPPPSIPSFPDTLSLTELRIDGLQTLTPGWVTAALHLPIPGRVTLDQLDRAFEKAYGTGLFRRITYQCVPLAEGTGLVVHVREQAGAYLRLGVHHDTDLKTALLVHTTIRPAPARGAQLALDARVGESPAVEVSHSIHPDRYPGFGLEFDVRASHVEVHTQRDGVRDARYGHTNAAAEIKLRTPVPPPWTVGGGVRVARDFLSPRPAPASPDYTRVTSAGLYGVLRMDTLDRLAHPREGTLLQLFATYVPRVAAAVPGLHFGAFQRLSVTGQHMVPIHDRIAIGGTYFLGGLRGGPVPVTEQFFIGGPYLPTDTTVPLTGYRFLEIPGTRVQTLQASLHYEPVQNRFVAINAGLGKSAARFENRVKRDGLFYGLGVTGGMLSFAGPLELTVMWGSRRNDVLTYLNFGYAF